MKRTILITTLLCLISISDTLSITQLGKIGKVSPNEISRLINDGEKLIFSKPEQAFHKLSNALQLSEQNGFKIEEAKAHESIGILFFHQGVFLKALHHFELAELFYKNTKNSVKIAENQSRKGLIYYNIKNPREALQSHLEALKIYESIGDEKGVAMAYGNLGRLYEKKQLYKNALEYQQKALALCIEIGDKKGLATILENIGSIYEDKEEYSLSLNYYERAYDLSKEMKDSVSIIICLNNLGDIYRKTSQYPLAEKYTCKALQMAEQQSEKYQQSSAYKDLGKLYKLKGEYEKAYNYLEIGRNLYEDMYEEESTRQLGLMQTLFESEKKNNEIKLLENNEKLNNGVKILLIAMLLVVLISAATIIWNQRHKLKLKSQLMEKKILVFETQEQLMNKELENVQLREKHLLNEIELKGKSLTAYTLNIINKNKALEEIRERLNDVLKGDTQIQKRQIKNILKLIDQNFTQDKDWADFKNVFEQVHQDFFDELTNINPQLTPADLRLAALLRLNLPSKDIATTLGISQDSLRIARYRLRKKLNIGEGRGISHFILSV